MIRLSIPRCLRTASVAILALLFSGPAAADLENSVRRILKQGTPPGSQLAVSIRELPSSDEVFAFQASRPFIPASNMKLITTGAALVSLGPDFRFRTRMRLLERPDRPAELLIVGDGDPSFADPSLLESMTWNRPDGSRAVGLDCDRFLGIWAEGVRDAGVTAIGAVVADDRVFERNGFHPEWPKDQFSEPYCAEVNGLNFHHNLVQIWMAPVAGGPARIVRTSPDLDWLPRRNRTTSDRSAKAKQSFWIERPFGSNSLTLNGNVRVESTDPVPITLQDMPSLLAELLARRLRTVGVEVSESRLAAAEDPVDQGRPIGPPVETALEVVVRRANTDSDNLSAESLLKRVAAHETRQPGSWTSATTAIPSVLARRITDPAALAGLVVSDGSGLSRANRITASLLTRWIAAIDADPTISSRFRESLAVGGRTGTVKNRFKDLERTGCTVYCKTGFVRGVSCLSGLVVAPDGRAMAFSILGNDLTAGNAIGDAKTLQERIVRAIADELTRHRTALGG
jgi:D-alanyl-D-alanine carboxypeptidase/D-alanyl-D-alanine-endopeptidase (penicillin-binding protein 4)